MRATSWLAGFVEPYIEGPTKAVSLIVQGRMRCQRMKDNNTSTFNWQRQRSIFVDETIRDSRLFQRAMWKNIGFWFFGNYLETTVFYSRVCDGASNGNHFSFIGFF